MPFTNVLIVLAAFYHILLALAGPELQDAYFAASTDGVLRKDEMLQALARVRVIVESPITLRAMAAARGPARRRGSARRAPDWRQICVVEYATPSTSGGAQILAPRGDRLRAAVYRMSPIVTHCSFSRY